MLVNAALEVTQQTVGFSDHLQDVFSSVIYGRRPPTKDSSAEHQGRASDTLKGAVTLNWYRDGILGLKSLSHHKKSLAKLNRGCADGDCSGKQVKQNQALSYSA